MPLAPFTDPGQADLRKAQDMVVEARRQRDSAAQQARHAVDTATASAPPKPSGFERFADEVSDQVSEFVDTGAHVLTGALEGVEGILKFARSLNPADPYNLTHPAEYVAGLSNTAAGLLHSAMHPIDLLKGLVGTGWGSDPARALGKLVPNVALALATDGDGTAGSGAADVAVGLLSGMPPRLVRTRRPRPAGRSATAEAGAPEVAYEDWYKSDGPSFGPQGSASIEPDVGAMPSHAVEPPSFDDTELFTPTVFDSAGSNLGNVEHEIDAVDSIRRVAEV